MALMTVAEVARETGLKEPTIRKMIAARRLESVKLGRAIRVPAEAVENLIRLNTIPARVEHRG
jgi:excisionase family DNA binding protein